MSPIAGQLLLHEILPIIQAPLPRAVKRIGSEDYSELVQDCIASAAQMLDTAERAGKPLIAKSIAFYAVQRAKTGRRSTSAGRCCPLAPATVLDGHSVSESLDAPANRASFRRLGLSRLG